MFISRYKPSHDARSLTPFIFIFCLGIGAILVWHAPGFGQVGPPCCQPAPIVADLSARPPNESAGALRGWLTARAQTKSLDELDSEVTALEGACATDCPPSFRAAHQILSDQLDARRPQPIPTPPCCTVESVAAARIALARPTERAERGRAAARVTGPQFRSAIIRQLYAWPLRPDEVPAWLERQLLRVPTREARYLQEALAGQCSPASPCPPTMTIGRVTVDRIVAMRTNDEEIRRLAAAQAEERDLRHGDWFANILSGIAGGLVAVFGALFPFFLGQRAARRQTVALEGTLSQLNRTLVALGNPSGAQGGPASRFFGDKAKPLSRMPSPRSSL